MEARRKWVRGIAACTLGMGVVGGALAQEPKKDEPQVGKAKAVNPKEAPKIDAAKEAAVPPVIPIGPTVPVATVTDDRFRQALAANPAQNSSVSPNMFADLGVGKSVAAMFQQTFTIQVPTVVTLPPDPNSPLGTPPRQVTILVPQQITSRVPFTIPTPGGTVGRIKVAEDNNPLPRDRAIFNYDYFSNTPLQPGGWDVNRFQFGLEKTFLDQMASIEVRLPFAGTLSSSNVPGLATGDTELGNLRLVLKGLFSRSETGAFGGGVAVTLPTADDTALIAPGGANLLSFDNQAVLIEPYLAFLLTPNESLFVQNWASLAFDPFGSPLRAGGNGFLPNQNLPRYHDRTILSLDMQVGYWLTRNPEQFLRGLAPFVELHYNAAVSNGTRVRTSNLSLGGFGDGLDELNTTVGVVADLANNMNIAMGAVFPLRGAPDRTFDYQVGLRLNWFFGAGAAERNASYVPVFGN